MPPKEPAAIRFHRHYRIDEGTGCWIWTGGCSAGYGMFCMDGWMVQAHRAAYILFVGPIPEGMTLDHLCRTPLCVNHEHLEPVPHIVNVQRGLQQRHPVVVKAANRHCRRAHWMDETTTYNDPRGVSRCRVCNAARMKIVRTQRKQRELTRAA